MKPLSEMTIADPRITQDPYAYYERLRNEDPVHFDEKIGTWLVTRYDDIVTVARDTEIYSDEMKVSKSVRSPFQDEVDDYMQKEGFMLLHSSDSFKVDGELHKRRRKLVQHAFSAPTVAKMQSRVADICHQQLASFSNGGKIDLIKDYAMPIPIRVICDALGLPMDHIDELSRAADAMVAKMGSSASREEAYQRARDEMKLHKFALEAIEKRRAEPSEDLISELVHARTDDPDTLQLTERELLSITTVSIAGGVDTTRNSVLMQTQILQDGAEEFKVSLLEAARNSPVVLFAAGSGGQPERYASGRTG